MKKVLVLIFLLGYLVNCASMSREFEGELDNKNDTTTTSKKVDEKVTDTSSKTIVKETTPTKTVNTTDQTKTTVNTTDQSKTTVEKKTDNPTTVAKEIGTTKTTSTDTSVAVNVTPKDTKIVENKQKPFDVWTFQGWGGEPSDLSAKLETSANKNYFFKKYSSKPSETAVASKSPSFMESSCKMNAIKTNKKKFFTEVYSASLPSEKVSTGVKIPSIENKSVESATCKPTGENQSFTSCECLLYVKIDGGKDAVVKKFSESM